MERRAQGQRRAVLSRNRMKRGRSQSSTRCQSCLRSWDALHATAKLPIVHLNLHVPTGQANLITGPPPCEGPNSYSRSPKSRDESGAEVINHLAHTGDGIRERTCGIRGTVIACGRARAVSKWVSECREEGSSEHLFENAEPTTGGGSAAGPLRRG